MLLFFSSTLLISANIMALGSIRVTNEEGFLKGEVFVLSFFVMG